MTYHVGDVDSLMSRSHPGPPPWTAPSSTSFASCLLHIEINASQRFAPRFLLIFRMGYRSSSLRMLLELHPELHGLFNYFFGSRIDKLNLQLTT